MIDLNILEANAFARGDYSELTQPPWWAEVIRVLAEKSK
jgi:hypothetical protein